MFTRFFLHGAHTTSYSTTFCAKALPFPSRATWSRWERGDNLIVLQSRSWLFDLSNTLLKPLQANSKQRTPNEAVLKRQLHHCRSWKLATKCHSFWTKSLKKPWENWQAEAADGLWECLVACFCCLLTCSKSYRIGMIELYLTIPISRQHMFWWPTRDLRCLLLQSLEAARCWSSWSWNEKLHGLRSFRGGTHSDHWKPPALNPLRRNREQADARSRLQKWDHSDRFGDHFGDHFGNCGPSRNLEVVGNVRVLRWDDGIILSWLWGCMPACWGPNRQYLRQGRFKTKSGVG